MSPDTHELPPGVVARLASGGGGEQAVRHLVAAQEGKHRLLILGVVHWARDSGHPQAKAADQAYDLLAEIESAAPDAVRRVVRHPAVGAWARQTLRGLRRGSDADPARLGSLAAAAAVLAGVACWTEVPGGTVMLPTLGRLTGPPGDLVDLRVHQDGTLETAGSPVVLDALHRLSFGDAAFLLDDLDPFRWDRDKVTEGRLSQAERDQWQRCLTGAWRMLTEHHWTIAEECRAAITVLTPIKGPAKGMDSASSRDRFGTIALSVPPDARWLASTLAHEIQHAKLGALLDVVDLTLPDDRLYYAPWRPDPRPLAGLIQGAYAYLGVAGFWRRQRAHERDLRPHIEFAHWRDAAHTVTEVMLAGESLTEQGRPFVTAMRDTLAPWLDEPVPAAALAAARAEAAAHREAWKLRNPDFRE
ncbi:HEXXH motif domain-containing protein [Planotetraspora kaengkrachanensis]|uniref:HEXXH motif domain-containing protein n=1 Tax=Planotetraspora kaengkrachanensis TaxID=575193 RepID=A0A8J3PY79_9ACTN|nr:HEXXH motif domain-containing protein [Planotetraspora kaengkrachanensis]GIG83326.1 HEXXH motif domain-containing protein [Planotetraspora kaengkrachanensis]